MPVKQSVKITADKLDINLITAAQRKIEVNERKYPVDKAKGSAKKYTDYV
jgi:dCTP diphosphatase